MRLEIRLFAYFREGRGKKVFLDVEDYTVKEVLRDIRIDAKAVHLLLVNGRDGKPETVLQDGDVVALFPPVGGG